MVVRRENLAEGETYHCFNRGAHKMPVFLSKENYERFMLLMFLCNDEKSLDFRWLAEKYKGRTFVDIFQEEKPSLGLVDILGYCLMPNHFHLILRQVSEQGIPTFMRKLCTAYSMYFNKKHDHSGVLFQGRYKSSHIDSEPYFRYIFSYVHLNPLDLFDASWKENGIADKNGARKFLQDYAFSSFYDFCVGERKETILLAKDLPDFLTEQNDLEELLQWQMEDDFTKVRPL